MATVTLNPSSYTYVNNHDKTTSHAGASQLQTSKFFVQATASDTAWNNASQTSAPCQGAILKFTRSSVLKYSRINSVRLTWVVDGYSKPNPGDPYDYTDVGNTSVASYSTTYPLSSITWSSFRQNGVLGEWNTLAAAYPSITKPATRTADITALFNGDQSGDDFVIVISAGSGYDWDAYGTGFKTWIDPSSTYLTVEYTAGAQPAPTPLYPKDQTLIETDSTLFSWQFNSETAALQASVQLEYKDVDDADYTALSLTQSGYSYTLNTRLPAGSYQWRLKATNDAGVTSGYSEVAYFNIVGRPAVPIINEPANKALTEISWNTNSQQSFEIILKDQSGKELIHETLATAEASYKPNLFLKGQYLVSVRVMNDSMMWSDWAEKGFTISAAGPAAATIKIVSQSGISAVRIGYTLPADTNAVLMRTCGEETKILAILNEYESEYTDATVSAETVYKYFIRTYVDGYTDTTELEAFTRFDGAIFQTENEFLNLDTSDEQYLPHSEEISAPYALNEFSGRTYYTIERGRSIDSQISRRFYVEKGQKKLLDRMSLALSVFYRDNKGNAFRAAILRTSYDAHLGDGYLATITLVRLNEEEVEVNV